MPFKYNVLPALVLVVFWAVPRPAGADCVPSFLPTGHGPQYTTRANGTLTAVPSIAAYRLENDKIKVDGILDDPAWEHAQTGWGWRQQDPSRGGQASVLSTFKVAYDHDAVYFAVACWEEDMTDVSSRLTRRDDLQSTDLVSIYIDPYHDRTTGYNFRVNPAGVQADSYLFDNGRRDPDWNAVWQAEVGSDDHGWYVEMRIPFSQIRFKPGEEMTWGLQVYRWLYGRGEDTGWVVWDRNAEGFVSRWGELTGIRDVPNPRKLEVVPYVVTKLVDPADPDPATDQWQNPWNLGADFKYGITSNLTLNATFQPDFGQVEADPAELNLSPFETFYAEKRPFFIEGAQYFQHPDFRLFYSRRIGTGDPNARIRGAAKLTGKLDGNTSVALLAAATDIGVPGKTHNPFIGGSQKTYYGLVRLGREFDAGNHRCNLMGTVVRRDHDSFASVGTAGRLLRDAYTGGLDFELNFADRDYRISGSAVGTIVDSFADMFDPELDRDTKYGTGGALKLEKAGGNLRGEVQGRWESDKLDPNDMGFLRAPDEENLYGQVEYRYNSEGSESWLNSLQVEVEGSRSWLYAGGCGLDPDTGQTVWSYGRGHRQSSSIQFSTFAQHRDFHHVWFWAGKFFDGTSKYATRHTDPGDRNSPRGPLMANPGWVSLACGVSSDWRRPLSVNLNLHRDLSDHMDGKRLDVGLRWNQNEHFSHTVGIGLSHTWNDAQWLWNYVNDGSQPGVNGIGGIDYVFAVMDQRTWVLTLRTNYLLDRNRSLQLYVQPFLTRGRYTDARYLATPDTYDLRPYDLDAGRYDFNYGAFNLNLVYRWEYRSGSTIFLVWSHSQERYDWRGGSPDPQEWSNGFDAGFPFGTEPGNTLLAKLSYWFSV